MAKEHETNINNIKPCATLQHVGNAWESIPELLNSMKTMCQNYDYNLRPHD